MIAKSIRSMVFALVVFSSLSLVQLAIASQTEEILSGHGGGTGNSGETVAIQSSGNAQLDAKNEKQNDFQSSARFFVGGAEFAGGYTNLSSETSLTAACAYGKSAGASDGRLKDLCQDPKSLRAIDAAAKVLGIPSVVIACIEAQIQLDEDQYDDSKEDKRSQQEIEQEEKAKNAKYKQLLQHYKRIKGDRDGGNEEGKRDYIFENAYDYFWMIETVAKTMKQSLQEKDPNEAYWDLVKFIVASRFGGRENAKQFLEGGGSLGPGSQRAFAGVKKCIEAARAQHDNKSK